MRGASTPTGLMIAPGINGFQEDMNQPYKYDPEMSKQLLKDAGYADGFPVTFDCPNDRYVNDEAICTAIVPMLERIGIDVTLNAQTKSLHFNKIGQAVRQQHQLLHAGLDARLLRCLQRPAEPDDHGRSKARAPGTAATTPTRRSRR